MEQATQPTTFGWARQFGGAVLNALLPPQCVACRTPVDRVGALCPSCWGDIAFITAPLCDICGLPFEFDVGDEAVCGACIARRPDFDRARALMRYDEASRDIVLAFKHADRTEAAPALGRWLARAGSELLAGADLIVPVPLHRWRLLARRYNQSALLAAALARETGIAHVPDLLCRRRWTRSQGGLSPKARRRNVRGAFAVRQARIADLTGRHVVLVDDVHTTGATLEACARVLRHRGAASVSALCLARVVRPRDGAI